MRLEARGKINWSLDITGLREDGYHLMDMLMQPVTLADTVTLEPAEDLSLTTGGFPLLKADERHLALRAARLLREHTGCSRGAAIHVFKRIPVGAGMGGGSADAAAVLFGLNRLCGDRSFSGGAGSPGAPAGGGCALLPAGRPDPDPGHRGTDGKSALLPLLFPGSHPALPGAFHPGCFSGLSRLPDQAHPDTETSVRALAAGDLLTCAESIVPVGGGPDPILRRLSRRDSLCSAY